jgi:threonine aldolase
MIDLRSDTRTLPDRAMRAVMATAAVGDDSFGDDPSVRALEERGAALAGKTSALFTCGGTMSNLLAIFVLRAPDKPSTIVSGSSAHLLHHENDGARVLAGCETIAVADSPLGELDLAELVRELARAKNRGRHAVVWLENPSNRRGGSAIGISATRQRTEVARQHGVRVHLDGARLPNASVALGVPMDELAKTVDTVAISLCKGLGAPAGSLLCGDRDLIERARYFRRMLGGTMHQSGILAAAGQLALDRIPRLAEDHRRAERLTGLLRTMPGIYVQAVPMPTNIVIMRFPGLSSTVLLSRLADLGVLGLPLSDEDVRFVVHREHTDADIDTAASRCAEVAQTAITADSQFLPRSG